MLKCTINGVDLEVKPGTTIIEAMYSNELRVAHYCWHPGLSVAGVCRLCMVEIEGNPRLQIACNTVITEGMKINNTSEKVKEAAKWGLDFHLINHPLDCPICDQAGECGLQDQYMEFGKYNPEMAERKVKKHKVVDLGPTVVLDSERCILCSRCVRFTDEVSKTNELGIFQRGDRSEIGTFDGKQLDNKYSLNTVDICPVGALTSKDFRFRQRVWYLKDGNTVCNGCSTGCSVKVYFNKEGFFRVRPVYNEKVNGHWMCDEGRDIYKFVNRDQRMLKAKRRAASGVWTELQPGAAAQTAATWLKEAGASSALVLTGQYTSEEYAAIVDLFVNKLGSKQVYHWQNNPQDMEKFDGLLLRGDRNPNTRGLQQVLQKHSIDTKWSDLEAGLSSGKITNLVVAGPENLIWFPDLMEKMKLAVRAPKLVWLQSTLPKGIEELVAKEVLLIPMKSFVEKSGTFVNHQGLEQKFSRVTTVVSEALTMVDAASLFAGQQIAIKVDASASFVESERPVDVVMKERSSKKNEFTLRRGAL